jgi:hypothetical protein
VVFNGYAWQPVAIGAAAHFPVNLLVKVTKLIGGGAVGYAVIATLVAVAFAMTASSPGNSVNVKRGRSVTRLR